jgi:esterase/lipase superfamily enzyme
MFAGRRPRRRDCECSTKLCGFVLHPPVSLCWGNPLFLARIVPCFAWLCCAVLISGCALRPGPEVLIPTQASVPGAKIVTVFVATTRSRQIPDSNVYDSSRARGINYAEFRISLPPSHQPGQIEWPTGAVDPAHDFATVEQEVLDRDTFYRRIAQSGGGHLPVNAGIFVHGFNNNFQESLYRLAQLAADSDVQGVPILFAWPSEAKLGGYLADKDAVTYSRDQLADLLVSVTHDPAIGKVTLLGHSMGGWLTAEALRQLRLTRQDAALRRLTVVLAAPDIDVDVFKSQLDVIGPLSPPMTILVSRQDLALALSSRIAGNRPRVGMLNVDDPRVQQAALRNDVQVIDVSALEPTDAARHDGFVQFASLYGRLSEKGPGTGLRQAGAFVANTVGAGLSAPFDLVGSALANE